MTALLRYSLLVLLFATILFTTTTSRAGVLRQEEEEEEEDFVEGLLGVGEADALPAGETGIVELEEEPGSIRLATNNLRILFRKGEHGFRVYFVDPSDGHTLATKEPLKFKYDSFEQRGPIPEGKRQLSLDVDLDDDIPLLGNTSFELSSAVNEIIGSLDFVPAFGQDFFAKSLLAADRTLFASIPLGNGAVFSASNQLFGQRTTLQVNEGLNFTAEPDSYKFTFAVNQWGGFADAQNTFHVVVAVELPLGLDASLAEDEEGRLSGIQFYSGRLGTSWTLRLTNQYIADGELKTVKHILYGKREVEETNVYTVRFVFDAFENYILYDPDVSTTVDGGEEEDEDLTYAYVVAVLGAVVVVALILAVAGAVYWRNTRRLSKKATHTPKPMVAFGDSDVEED
ncbi:hypothetical protein QOT17_023709 [Balamuthia mandrillaris]